MNAPHDDNHTELVPIAFWLHPVVHAASRTAGKMSGSIRACGTLPREDRLIVPCRQTHGNLCGSVQGLARVGPGGQLHAHGCRLLWRSWQSGSRCVRLGAVQGAGMMRAGRPHMLPGNARCGRCSSTLQASTCCRHFGDNLVQSSGPAPCNILSHPPTS
jgi:hypothetical protein